MTALVVAVLALLMVAGAALYKRLIRNRNRVDTAWSDIDMQGSIEVGKRADLVVLDRNLFELPPSEITEANVTMTIFAGRTVYE